RCKTPWIPLTGSRRGPCFWEQIRSWEPDMPVLPLHQMERKIGYFIILKKPLSQVGTGISGFRNLLGIRTDPPILVSPFQPEPLFQYRLDRNNRVENGRKNGPIYSYVRVARGRASSGFSGV